MSFTTFPSLRTKPADEATAPGDEPGKVPKPAWVRPKGRRSRRRIVVGAAVLAVGAGAFSMLWSSQQRGLEVLVLTHALTPGQVISASDLGQARIPADSGLPALPATELRTVVGRRAAYAEAPGTVVTAGMLGRTAMPAAGTALVALNVKQGQYPPDLAPGMTVEVIPGQVTATVTAVTPANNAGDAVVTLQVSTAAAGQVATAADGASLIELSAGGGSQ
jgi:hypothetical protein